MLFVVAIRVRSHEFKFGKEPEPQKSRKRGSNGGWSKGYFFILGPEVVEKIALGKVDYRGYQKVWKESVNLFSVRFQIVRNAKCLIGSQPHLLFDSFESLRPDFKISYPNSILVCHPESKVFGKQFGEPKS